MVIETGLGGASTDWRAAQAKMATNARVSAYDRAGLGRSPGSGDDTRISAELVADLHALLAAAEIEPPYVLEAIGAIDDTTSCVD